MNPSPPGTGDAALPWRTFYRAWAVLAAVVALVQATSVLMEHARFGIPTRTWCPFVDEISGLAMLCALLPIVRRFDARYPFRRDDWWRAAAAHLAFTLPFAVLHTAGFVALRTLIYPLFGGDYDFGPPLAGLLYEYRKISLGYVAAVGSLYGFRHYAQLRALLAMPEATARDPGAAGDAGPGDPPPAATPPDAIPAADAEPAAEVTAATLAARASVKAGPVPTHFVAHAQHREYIVRTQDIDFVEAAGNYSVLHAPGGPYRVRQTMAALERTLDPAQFVRVHRSYLVRLGAIREIQPWYHGDQRLVLHGGAVVNLSRRYRDRLRGVPLVTA